MATDDDDDDDDDDDCFTEVIVNESRGQTGPMSRIARVSLI